MTNKKKSMPVLYLFTTSYPYNFAKENTFLETEIHYLSKYFQVTIVPKYLYGDIYPSFPNYATVDTSFALEFEQKFLVNKNKKFHVFEYFKFITLFLSLIFWRELFKILKIELSKNSLYHLIYFAVSRSAARSWFKRKDQEINDIDSLIYGWWLTPEILGIGSLSRKCKVISRAHGGDLYAWRQDPKYFPFRGNDIKKIDSIFSCSNDGRLYLAGNYSSIKDRISVSYLGISDFGINLKNITPTNTVVIVSCSVLDPIKQIDLLIEGLDLFCCDNPSVNLTWFHFGNGVLKQSLEKIAQNKKSFNSFFIPYKSRDELMKFYRDNYITTFINSSASEGLPVSMIEAASCGLPLVGPNIGGISEIIIDNVNGFLMDNTVTPESIAGSITKLYTLDGEKFNTFRRNSRLIWSRRFNADHNYREFADNLISILES